RSRAGYRSCPARTPARRRTQSNPVADTRSPLRTRLRCPARATTGPTTSRSSRPRPSTSPKSPGAGNPDAPSVSESPRGGVRLLSDSDTTAPPPPRDRPLRQPTTTAYHRGQKKSRANTPRRPLPTTAPEIPPTLRRLQSPGVGG